jgi:hypothetical protein
MWKTNTQNPELLAPTTVLAVAFGSLYVNNFYWGGGGGWVLHFGFEQCFYFHFSSFVTEIENMVKRYKKLKSFMLCIIFINSFLWLLVLKMMTMMRTGSFVTNYEANIWAVWILVNWLNSHKVFTVMKIDKFNGLGVFLCLHEYEVVSCYVYHYYVFAILCNFLLLSEDVLHPYIELFLKKREPCFHVCTIQFEYSVLKV